MQPVGLFWRKIVLIHQLYIVVLMFSHTPRRHDESELRYRTNDLASKTSPIPLPTLADKPDEAIVLSVVIPCYNETGRLGIMMEEAIGFLSQKYANGYEIIIVDDGSRDGTAQYSLDLAAKYNLSPGTMRVVQLVKNRGKGGAVTHGMQYIRGSYGLFVDADGASKFSDVSKLLEVIEKNEGIDKKQPAVAVGSRAHMVNTDAVVKRSLVRNFLMYSLHALVFVFGIRTIKDTQCGFKLFNRASIPLIFPYMHTEGWIFDVEILILAINQNIPIVEVPISWHEVGGSKIDLARDSINMAIDLVVTRLAYLMGIYKVGKAKME